MDKTIEKKFFKTFESGGTLHKCFDWMQEKYDLGFKLNKEDESKPKKVLSTKWQQFYDDILPKLIREETEAFDYSVIENTDNPLIDEIANNLDECKNDMQRDRYIFSLLTPFKEYSDKFNPIAEIKELKGEVNGICGIKDFERNLAMWENMPESEPIKNINGEPAGTPKEQAKACKEFIEEYKNRIERAEFLANKYRELIDGSSNNERWLQKGTVENCMSTLHFYLLMFARRLDALLLKRGINILWYQNECGIYLFERRDITAIEYEIGSYKLARKYIDEALPKYPVHKQGKNTETAENEITLPSELDTEKARKCFAKAIKAGYMRKNDNGYKWLFGGNKGQARLGYFCNKVFVQPRPINKLESLFSVQKLSASITSADYEAKRADVKKWRNEINNNIFND